MFIISWNINGIKSAMNKGFCDFITTMTPDILCLQETRIDKIPSHPVLNTFIHYESIAKRKGYSGTAILSKYPALNVLNLSDFGCPEGRLIGLEYKKFYLINCYAPQSRRDLSRLEYRVNFDNKLYNLLIDLSYHKPIIICGDFNVAHKEIDLYYPKSNMGHAGFTDIERSNFSKLLDGGFIDSFRYFNPTQKLNFTWWSYRRDVRAKNIGWRLDYILCSNVLERNLFDAVIYQNIMGSDHCPIGAVFNF